MAKRRTRAYDTTGARKPAQALEFLARATSIRSEARIEDAVAQLRADLEAKGQAQTTIWSRASDLRVICRARFVDLARLQENTGLPLRKFVDVAEAIVSGR